MRYQKSEQADPHQQPANRLKRASDSAKKMVWLKMAECSAPAVVVGVAVNGKPVWKHGREAVLLSATVPQFLTRLLKVLVTRTWRIRSERRQIL